MDVADDRMAAVLKIADLEQQQADGVLLLVAPLPLDLIHSQRIIAGMDVLVAMLRLLLDGPVDLVLVLFQDVEATVVRRDGELRIHGFKADSDVKIIPYPCAMVAGAHLWRRCREQAGLMAEPAEEEQGIMEHGSLPPSPHAAWPNW